MPKSDKVLYYARIFEIQGWIVDGCHYMVMVGQILSKGWTQARKHEDKIRSAKRMIADARDNWIEEESGDIEQRRKIKIAELKQIKRGLNPKYKDSPDGIRALMSVEKEIIKLEGITPPKQIELSGKDGKPIETNTTLKLSNDEIRTISSALDKEF